MIHALGGTNSGLFVMFAQKRWQAQGFEVMGQQQFGGFAHDGAPVRRLM